MPSRRPTRPAWTAGLSTGRRCGASTRPTATGTWSAPAPRRRRSPAETLFSRSPPGPPPTFPAHGGLPPPVPPGPSPFTAPPSLVVRSLVPRSSLLGPGGAAAPLARERGRGPSGPRLPREDGYGVATGD